MNVMHKTFHPTLSEESTDPQEALDILCCQRRGAHPDDWQPIECGTRQQAACTLSKLCLVAPQEALDILHGQQLGIHPDDGELITLETGKYGAYLKHGATFASLPKVCFQLTSGIFFRHMSDIAAVCGLAEYTRTASRCPNCVSGVQ